MSLIDVKHQPQAQRILQRAIASGRIPHAYIFHGPDGVGKELFARGLAELLLCGQPVEREAEENSVVASKTARGPLGQNHGSTACTGGSDPVGTAPATLRVGCGSCEDCRMVDAGTHPDWHAIYRQLSRDHPDPAVRRRTALDIGVDVLRHFVIQKVAHTPVRGRAKVFVIREADRITVQAQNALLKTLEEPPGTTFIILLVSALDRLLATTLSRCQLVGFAALPTSFVRAELARRRPELPVDQRDWYARLGGGSLGTAILAVEDELHALDAHVRESLGGSTRGDRVETAGRRAPLCATETGKLWTELAGRLADRYRKRDSDITDTEATRRGLKTIFHLAACRYADLLRAQVGCAGPNDALSFDLVSTRTHQHPERGHLIDAVNRLAEAERQLDLNANTQLVIETLLNDLARLERARVGSA